MSQTYQILVIWMNLLPRNACPRNQDDSDIQNRWLDRGTMRCLRTGLKWNTHRFLRRTVDPESLSRCTHTRSWQHLQRKVLNQNVFSRPELRTNISTGACRISTLFFAWNAVRCILRVNIVRLTFLRFPKHTLTLNKGVIWLKQVKLCCKFKRPCDQAVATALLSMWHLRLNKKMFQMARKQNCHFVTNK